MLHLPRLPLMVPIVLFGAYLVVDTTGGHSLPGADDEFVPVKDVVGSRDAPVGVRGAPRVSGHTDGAGLPLSNAPAHGPTRPGGRYDSSRAERVDVAAEVAGLVDELSYQHYLDDVLYAHDGDNRGWGPEHDLARDNIAATLESFGLSVELHPFPYFGLEYSNVVATQVGNFHPDEQFIVCAHYDSAYNPGADDNGSGVAGVLEIARVLAQYQTDYTVKYIAFDQEEMGMEGSEAYVRDHREDAILSVVNLDMIAWHAGNYTVGICCEFPSTSLQSVLADAVDQYGGGLSSELIGQGIGDDGSFAFAGFKACCLGDSYGSSVNPCYHEPCDSVDTPDYISYDYASDITRSMAAFLAGQAGAHHAGDCNDDGIPDVDQIQADPDLDCTANGVLDECELDCNENGVADTCDIADDISEDCTGNEIPDDCEPDCNDNGTADSCDIAAGPSEDCDGDGIPDECQGYNDCNGNDIRDRCDIAAGTSQDCNDNHVPDDCEPDCNGNGVPDDCDIRDDNSEDCGLVTHDCCLAHPPQDGPGCSNPAIETWMCSALPSCCEVEWHLGCAMNVDVRCGGCDGAQGNGIPDECEMDCNANGVADSCDIASGTSEDCSLLGHDCCVADLDPGCSDPDIESCVCDLPGYAYCCDTVWDCRCAYKVGSSGCGFCQNNGGNGIPDECEPDCNNNAAGDSCDIAGGLSGDCNANGVPDECEPDEDCNNNGIQDICDLAAGTSSDCNANVVPDECDIEEGTSQDCNENGVPDECEPDEDCNGNGVQDICDLATGTSEDENGNGVLDECEGVPPACEPGGPACVVPGDCTGAWLGADCVGGECYIPKNRYLTIDPTVNEYEVAYEVELIEAADYPEALGRTWWVDVPQCYDYPNGDVVLPSPTTCAGPDRFGWVSKLTSSPVTRTWAEVPVHVTDCGIAPAVKYEIRASGNGGVNFSEPLEINTAPNPEGVTQSWGDITGGPVPGMPGLWLAPERATNLGDVQAAIRTFENLSAATGFPPRVWVDVEIDQVVSLGDIQFIIMAFEGKAYADINLPLIGIHPMDCP